jgi:HlyD family secretion protein
MRNKLLVTLAIMGILAGIVSAYIYGIKTKPLPPAFTPASNPYEKGIYANGIIESYQPSGENINIYPEVPGVVTRILVAEGQHVNAGTPILMLDDSVQRANVEQLKAQAESVEELIGLTKANLKSLQDTLDKQMKSYELDPRSVSKDALDSAQNAVEVQKENLAVAQKQYDASFKAYQAANALLSKYVIHAPSDSAALAINTAVGSYISSQGTYDSYTGSFEPPIVMGMGDTQNYIGVRCYVDEILVHRLPQSSQMHARMSIRGTNINIPLEFVREQPYVSPKIELSNQRTERVDVRVLPVIFRFAKPKDITLYPGQLVDVYIGDE